MRTTLIAIMTIALALPLSAQQPMDFWRIREGSAVTVVLGTGGECKGKVAKRVDGALTVQLSEESSACGARDALVTVSEANTRTVERAPKSSGKRAAKSAAAVGVAAGAGLLLTEVPPRAALGVLAGGLVGAHLLVRNLDHDSGPGKGYVLYVSRLGQ